MKKAEAWLAQMKKLHGKSWENCPSTRRLERFLTSEPGRVKVLSCCKANLGLTGDPKNPEVRGIEECHIVIEELKKMAESCVIANQMQVPAAQSDSQVPAAGQACNRKPME